MYIIFRRYTVHRAGTMTLTNSVNGDYEILLNPAPTACTVTMTLTNSVNGDYEILLNPAPTACTVLFW